MNNSRHTIIAAFVISSVLGLTGMGDAVAVQSTASPDRVTVTVNQVDISMNDVNDYRTLFTASTPSTLDASSNQELGSNDTVPVGAYRALRVTLSEMSWSVASWGTMNRSPCTGGNVGGGNGPVDLRGHSVFYFKTPDLGGNTLAYYLAHPPLSGYVGDAEHPFVLASPITVLKDLPTTVNLTLDVDQTLACNSVSLFSLAGSGPVATIAGSKTGLTGGAGAYVDSYFEEIGVANSGNNSLTRYGQSASGDVTPETGRSLIGPATLLNEPTGVALSVNQADHTKDELFIANRGNNTIAVFYSSSSGNSAPLRSISGMATGLNLPEGIVVDAANSELVVANSGADSGNGSVTFYDLAANQDALPLRTIIGAGTGLSQPSGVALHPDSGGDPTKTTIVVANHGNKSVTIYNRNGLLIKTLAGLNTQLNGPAGVAVYSDPNNSANDEIIVANEGSSPGTGTISIYGWNTVMNSSDGNVSPVTTITGLNTPTGLYLDTAQNQIGVVQAGDQVAMVFQPSILPVSSNMADSDSALLGDYNILVYGVDLKAVNHSGVVIPVVVSERGRVNFDGSGGVTLLLDTQLGRQVLEPDCLTDLDAGVGITKSGYYGVNEAGNFYVLLPGTGGSFQGAFLPDGSVFVGSVYDSSEHLRLIYGVRTASSEPYPYLTSDGTSTGTTAHYGYTTYRNDLWTIGRFDIGSKNVDTLEYLLGIGMAETDAENFLGLSGDGNAALIENPVGEASDPAGNVIYRPGFGRLLTGHAEPYNNSNPPGGGGGDIQNEFQGLTGAVTPGGATMIFAIDTTTKDSYTCPNNIGFGMGLRQQPAGTFRTSSIKGTYFLAAFGDRFDVIASRSRHRASAMSLTFDGKGHVQIAEIDNQEGMLATDQISLTYQVNSRVIPSNNPKFLVDVVDLYGRGAVGPYASALIGEDPQSLSFFRSLKFVNDTPNPIRLLGLALFQHS
jgi:hypothetical protein